MEELSTSKDELIEYQDEGGDALINVAYDNGDLWLTQEQIAKLFGITKQMVSRHISNIYKEGELSEGQGVNLKLTPVDNGQAHKIAYYNLDVIISVGYRARRSKTATHFRQWATRALKDRITGASRFAAELQEDALRLLARGQINDGTDQLIDVATRKHQVTNKSSFLEAGDRGLYNLTRDEVEGGRGIPSGELYDYAGSTELGMHVFRLTQTAAALMKDARAGHRHDQVEAEAIHYDIAGRIRAMSHKNSEMFPEDLPISSDSIDAVKGRAFKGRSVPQKGDGAADGTQISFL
jgi:hypothetical protein